MSLTSNDINDILFKKISGKASSGRTGVSVNSNYININAETKLSLPYIAASNIYAQSIPSIVPTDIITSTLTNGGTRSYSLTYPYIIKYTNIKLEKLSTNEGFSYHIPLVSNTTLANTYTNILSKAILPLLSTGNDLYEIKVQQQVNGVLQSISGDKYYIDRDAGVITFYDRYRDPNSTMEEFPIITFWRYEGELLDASLSLRGKFNDAKLIVNNDNSNATSGYLVKYSENSIDKYGGIVKTYNDNNNFHIVNNQTDLNNITTTNNYASLYINNLVSSGSLTSSGAVSGTSISGSSLSSSNTLAVTNGATVGSLTSSGAVSGNTLTVTNSATVGSLVINSTNVKLGSNAGLTSQSATGIAIGQNAGKNNQGANSIMIGANAGTTSSATNSICLNASGTEINPVNANSFYVSPIRSNSSATEGAYMLMCTNNNEIVSNPYIVQNNGSSNETSIYYNDTALCVKRDASNNGKQFRITGSTDPDRQLLIGYDTTNNRGAIQAIHQKYAFTNLLLNNDGGNVCIGTASDSGYKLNVGGAIGATGLTINGSVSGSSLSSSNTLAVTNGATVGSLTSSGAVSGNTLAVTNGATVGSLTSSGAVSGTSISGSSLSSSNTLAVTNGATVGSLTSSGAVSGNTLAVTNGATVGSLTSSGAVSGASLSTTGATSTGSLTVTNGATVGSLTTTGAISSNTLSVTGAATFGTINLNNISATSLTAASSYITSNIERKYQVAILYNATILTITTSNDYGVTWTNQSLPSTVLSSQFTSSVTYDIVMSANGAIFILALSSGLYTYKRSGTTATYTNTNADLNTELYTAVRNYLNDQTFAISAIIILSVCVSTSGNCINVLTVINGTVICVIRSVDSGNSWYVVYYRANTYSSSNQRPYLVSSSMGDVIVLVVPNIGQGVLLMITTDGGIIWYSKGGYWGTCSRFYLAMSPDGKNMVGSSGAALYSTGRSYNYGKNWSDVTGASWYNSVVNGIQSYTILSNNVNGIATSEDNRFTIATIVLSNVLYIAKRSNDDTWLIVNYFISSLDSGLTEECKIIMSKDGKNIYISFNNKMIISTNYGDNNSWTVTTNMRLCGISLANDIASIYSDSENNLLTVSRVISENIQTGATSTGSLVLNNNNIRLGNNAGLTSQGGNAIAIGANAGSNNQGINSIMIGANAGVTSSVANSVCLNASGIALNPANTGTYINPIRSNSSTNEGAYMLMYTNNNEIVSNPYIVQNNGSSNETNNFHNDTPLCIKRDSAVIGKHLKISGSTDPARQLLIGYDTTNNRGTIQAIHQNVTYTNLLLNDSGGNVCVGTTSDSGYKLNVNGTIGATGLVVTSTAIKLGNNAGNSSQGTYTVAIGANAGQNTQGNSGVAIGVNSGTTSQGVDGIAIGGEAGYTNQTTQAIAIGLKAGRTSQGNAAVAIGANAGSSNQGANSIMIGANAGATSAVANSVCLNASSTALNPANSGAYINPIRNDNTSNANILCYNTTSKEVSYVSNGEFNTSFKSTYTINNGGGNNIQFEAAPTSGAAYFRANRPTSDAGDVGFIWGESNINKWHNYISKNNYTLRWWNNSIGQEVMSLDTDGNLAIRNNTTVGGSLTTTGAITGSSLIKSTYTNNATGWDNVQLEAAPTSGSAYIRSNRPTANSGEVGFLWAEGGTTKWTNYMPTSSSTLTWYNQTVGNAMNLDLNGNLVVKNNITYGNGIKAYISFWTETLTIQKSYNISSVVKDNPIYYSNKYILSFINAMSNDNFIIITNNPTIRFIYSDQSVSYYHALIDTNLVRSTSSFSISYNKINYLTPSSPSAAYSNYVFAAKSAYDYADFLISIIIL